jgi:hypothetical protein
MIPIDWGALLLHPASSRFKLPLIRIAAIIIAVCCSGVGASSSVIAASQRRSFFKRGNAKLRACIAANRCSTSRSASHSKSSGVRGSRIRARWERLAWFQRRPNIAMHNDLRHRKGNPVRSIKPSPDPHARYRTSRWHLSSDRIQARSGPFRWPALAEILPHLLDSGFVEKDNGAVLAFDLAVERLLAPLQARHGSFLSPTAIGYLPSVAA